MQSPHDGQMLRARVVKSAGWVFAGRFLLRGLMLTKLVIMARVLEPRDLGLFGIVMLSLQALDTFARTGFHAALIQRKDGTHAYLDTAWTVQAIRGVVLAGALLAGAPLIAAFFGEPLLVPLLRVMSGCIALNGLTNVGVVYFRKDLQFHRQFLLDAVKGLTSFVLGVWLVFALRSVWALIWARLAAEAAQCAVSYVVHGYRPRPRLDRARAAELFRFGRWVLGSSIVGFLTMHGDDAFLGKLLGAGLLGVYQVAYQLASVPATEIAGLMNTVMMPAYAKVQYDARRLRGAFLSVFEVVTSLAVPLAAFIFFAAPQLVLGLLGPRWAPAVAPVQVLAVAALLRAIAATGAPVYVGTGRPHMAFRMDLARLLVIAATIYPLTRAFGTAGTAASVALGMAAALPLWARVAQVLGIRRCAMLKAAAPAGVLGLLVPPGVWLARLVPWGSPQLGLAAALLACGILCALGAWATGRWFGCGLAVQARKVLGDLRRRGA